MCSSDLVNPKLKNSLVIQGFIEDFQDDKKYDVIWMSHVLEHLVEPEILLNRIKKNLNENGIFFIEVPNSDHQSTLNDSIFLSPHVYHFSKDTLSNLCKRTGFRIIDCKIFRPATKIEAILNRLTKSVIELYPYFPRISCDKRIGRDLRIILRIK